MHSDRSHLSLLILVLLLLITTTGDSRSFSSSSSLQPANSVSDGSVHPHRSTSPYLLTSISGTEEAEEEWCEQTYGFMPCSTTAMGNLLLIIGYGYAMFLAATYLSKGSEMLHEILGPGIVGGLLLPVLCALSDAVIVLGKLEYLDFGSKAVAQKEISVGMGLLAGSTALLLTLVWGSCIFFGKCDIRKIDSLAIDGHGTKGFNLTGTGVSTDIWTCYGARIMTVSVIPIIVVQSSEFLNSTAERHLAILISFVISLVMLISYCSYQVFRPWIQRRRLAYAKHNHVISGMLKHFKDTASERLLTDDGEPKKEVIKKLFQDIDQNGDNFLSVSELKALIIGICFEEIQFDRDDAAKKIMKEFDTSKDNHIDITEFENGIVKWHNEAKQAAISTNSGDHHSLINDFHRHTKKEHALLGPEAQSDEEVEGVENLGRWKSIAMLLWGAFLLAVSADPLVDAVKNFSKATTVPSFFISFVTLPFITNSGEAFSAITFISHKKMRTASLTLSELYGKITVKILLCLSVFLGLIYFRGLKWDFMSKAMVLLIVCTVMGAFASFQTTFPLWTSSLACLLYPFSLALVYVLDHVYGWS
ncbi:calcium ion binding protein, putative [Ricinus communis]|uniref:Calcium ion binding protein, putative n=1 Tax=Ricinus communis TaxID=3988 RepID=B9S837_RICCO|nr:calcium ion binding protein, putative [Ricinus communis]